MATQRLGEHSGRAGGSQQGAALFVGMVLLMMLTLVALFAMRGTLLEMRLTSATAQHELAFEASEQARAIPEALLQSYAQYHGWPQSWGGNIPDALYGLDSTFANRPAWLSLLKPSGSTGLQASCGGALINLMLSVQCLSGQADSYNYTPSQWATTFVMNTCLDGTTTCGSSGQVVNKVAIVRDGVTVPSGNPLATGVGYNGPGVGPNGAVVVLLQIRSASTTPSGNGQATTIAQYRMNVSN